MPSRAAHRRSARGRTPLHRAAFNGQRDVVTLLLEHGADLQVKDNNGRGPRGP